MSGLSKQPSFQHLPAYRKNAWDKIGVVSASNGADIAALLNHYEAYGFFPDGAHPSVGYHTSTSSLDDPVRMATISLEGNRFLHVGLGHSYLITPYRKGGAIAERRIDVTVDVIEEARRVLHQFNLNGGIEYTFRLPNGSGRDEPIIVLAAEAIDKLLDLAAIDLFHQASRTPPT